MKNKNAFLVVFFLVISCISCSSEKAGIRDLKKLCEKDAGLTIYKTVEAEGYYDASRKGGALRELIQSEYKFTEFCNDKPNIASLFDEPGCWHLIKVSRDGNECSKAVDKAMWSSDVRGYPEFREKNCISVEKIDKPKAKYSFHNGIRFWSAKNGTSEFGRTYVELRERESGELLGEYISFSFNSKPRFTSPKSCRLLDEKFAISIKYDLIEKTIVPHKEK